MAADLESFYALDEWSVGDGSLVVRLVPDYFSTKIIEPVFTVSIVDPCSTQEANASLTRYKAEAIVDIRTTGTTLELWGEYDDVPLTIAGREVLLVRSAYSQQDLASAVEQLQSQLSASQGENAQLQRRVNDVEQFVLDLLNRAQTKKAMSSRDTGPSDAQIDALSRVLRHIRDA